MAMVVALTVATCYSRLFIGLVLIVLFTAIGHGSAAGSFCPTGGPEVRLSIFLLLKFFKRLYKKRFSFSVRQSFERINESQ